MCFFMYYLFVLYMLHPTVRPTSMRVNFKKIHYKSIFSFISLPSTPGGNYIDYSGKLSEIDH